MIVLQERWQLVLDSERNLQLFMRIVSFFDTRKSELVHAALEPVFGVVISSLLMYVLRCVRSYDHPLR